jgi:multiple sugar transport system substrate-binding protein
VAVPTRRRAGIVLAVVGCAVAAGCTVSDPERRVPDPSPTQATSPAATQEPVTVELAVFGSGRALGAYESLAEAFMANNPHVTVELEKLDTAEQVVDLVRDPASAPDVFLVAQDRLPTLVAEELVHPVDGLLEEREVDFGDGYQRSGLTAFAASAALQCMPHDVSPTVVYYNRDLVDLPALETEEQPAPSPLDGWDWEVFALAVRQAARGPADGVYLEPTLTALAPFVWSAGGEIVDDVQAPTTLTLSEGDARGALEQVLALVRDPLVTPTLSEVRRRGAVARFARGELAMIVGTRALTPRLRAAEGLDFDVMPLPSLGRFRTVTDMTGWCISSGTDQLETAGDLLAFAVGHEGASIVAREGYVVPSNLEVANSATFDQPALPPQSSFIFIEGVRRSQPLPFVPQWPQLTAALEPTIERMFYEPVIDLDTLLAGIDEQSRVFLAPEEDGDGSDSEEPTQAPTTDPTDG